jgi:hypothetical protein
MMIVSTSPLRIPRISRRSLSTATTLYCRIAHIAHKHSISALRQSGICWGHKTEVSNLDQLFSYTWATMVPETSSSSLSFRSSELSQPT